MSKTHVVLPPFLDVWNIHAASRKVVACQLERLKADLPTCQFRPVCERQTDAFPPGHVGAPRGRHGRHSHVRSTRRHVDCLQDRHYHLSRLRRYCSTRPEDLAWYSQVSRGDSRYTDDMVDSRSLEQWFASSGMRTVAWRYRRSLRTISFNNLKWETLIALLKLF